MIVKQIFINGPLITTHKAGDGHRPEDAHDSLQQRVGVPRATHAAHADSHA